MVKTLLQIGDLVYLKNDQDQLPRFVTAVCIRQDAVQYELVHSDYQPSWHYSFEISTEKDYKKSI